MFSEIEQIAGKPTLPELMERLARQKPIELDEEHRPEAIIRRARDADDPRNLG